MKVLCTASVAALLVSGGLAFAQADADAGAELKLSQEQCGSIWSRADTAGSGSLSDAQASEYVSDFSAVDTNSDGELSAAEFMAGCEQGLIRDSASTGAGDGASGSDKPARDHKSRPDFF